MGKRVLVFGDSDRGSAGWWLKRTAGNRDVTVVTPFGDTEELYAHIHDADVVVNALKIDETWGVRDVKAQTWRPNADSKQPIANSKVLVNYWAPQIASAAKALGKPFIQLSSAWVYAEYNPIDRKCGVKLPFTNAQPTFYWQMVEHMVRQQNPDALILRLPVMFSAHADNPVTRAAGAGMTEGYINPKTGDSVEYRPVIPNNMNAMIAVADDVYKSISGVFDAAWVDILNKSHPNAINVWPYASFELHTWYEVVVQVTPAKALGFVDKMPEKPMVRRSSTGRKFSVPNHRKVVAFNPCNEQGIYQFQSISHNEALQNYRRSLNPDVVPS